MPSIPMKAASRIVHSIRPVVVDAGGMLVVIVGTQAAVSTRFVLRRIHQCDIVVRSDDVMALESLRRSGDRAMDDSRGIHGHLRLFLSSGVPYNLMEQDRQLGELQAFLKQRRAIAIVGTRRMDPTREAPDGNSAWFNMACAISADRILGYHDKNHPVHFFNDGIPGTEAKSVATPIGKVGMPVCFDVDFQHVVRRMTLDGAEFIAAPTMDSESWSAKQHLQHALLFRHRAAENGRWIVVASTSGVTQMIDTTGQTRSQLPLMRKGVLDSHLFSRSKLTVFTRWGWMFGPACMWLAAVLVVVGFPTVWWLRSKRR
jgi:apolipoprotein N-acyltransferase